MSILQQRSIGDIPRQMACAGRRYPDVSFLVEVAR